MRSLLFIPADDEKKLGKGVGSGADALILDLEDSVSAPRKAAARAVAAQYIAATRPLERRPLLYVRINALDTPYWEQDLAGVIGSRPDGVLLPKARSGEDVHTLSIALNHAEERAGAAEGRNAHHRADDRGADLAAADAHLRRLQRATGGPNLGRGGPLRRHRRSRPTARRTDTGPRPTSWRATCACSRPWPPTCSRSTPCSSISVTRRACAPRRWQPRVTASPARWPSIPIRWRSSTRCSRRRPEEIAMSEEIVKAFADNPQAGVLGIRGADGGSRPHRPRRAHPRPRQGSDAAGVRSKARRYAGGGPNTRAAFRPVKPNEFDIV